MRKIVLASSNPGKIREVGQIFSGVAQIIPQSEFR